MNYTLSQAAKATGKSKSSISRAIDTGRLSATRNGGLFEIDAAELHRVFPLKVDANGVPLNESKNVPRNNLDAPGTGVNFSALDRRRGSQNGWGAAQTSPLIDVRYQA